MTASTLSLPTDVHGRGPLASRPAAGFAGREYFATDGSGTSYRDNGTSWDAQSSGSSALTVREVDGTPSDSAVTELVFPNGAVAIASHVATISDGFPLGLTGATAATRYVGGTSSGAPTTGTFAVGDFVVDQEAAIWVCTVAGTPGTWTEAAGGGGTGGAGYSFLGYNTVGASWETLTANRVYCKQITVTDEGTIDSVDVYLRPSNDNIASMHVMVLADNAGAPGTLIAASANPSGGLYLSNSASMPGAARWVSVPLGVRLTAGTYWIAFIGDIGRWDVAYDTGTDQYFTASAFLATGAYPSAWAITTSARRYSIRANFAPAGPGAAGSSTDYDRSPNPTVDDVEFKSSADNGGFTVLGSFDTNVSNADVLSNLHLAKTATGTFQVHGLYKAIPSMPFTVTAKLSDVLLDANYQQYGLMLGEASPGKLLVFGPTYQSANGIPEYVRGLWASRTSRTSVVEAGPAKEPSMPWRYIRLVVNSSTDVTCYHSRDGRIWQLTFATVNPAFTIGTVGLFLTGNDNSVAAAAYFDWIRFGTNVVQPEALLWQNVGGGPAGVVGPVNVPGLGTWLDASQIVGYADGDSLTMWPNMAEGRDGAANAIATAPLYKTGIVNGYPVVRFNSTGAYALNSWAALAQANTWFVVFKMASIAQAYSGIIGHGLASDVGGYFVKSNGKSAYYPFYTFNTPYDGTGAITFGTTDWNYVTAVHRGATFDTRRNGAVDKTGTAWSGVPAAYPLIIGSQFAASRILSGDIAEVLIYDRGLTSAEIAVVEAYLAAKYAI